MTGAEPAGQSPEWKPSDVMDVALRLVWDAALDCPSGDRVEMERALYQARSMIFASGRKDVSEARVTDGLGAMTIEELVGECNRHLNELRATHELHDWMDI